MKLFFRAIFFLALNTFISCDHKKNDEQKKPPIFTDSMLKAMQFVKAENKLVEEDLMLTANIDYNQDKVVDIYPLVGGRVVSLKADLGDFVNKGQVLANILSGDVAEIEKSLLTAEGNVSNAKRKLDAANDMYKSGLLSEKDKVQAQTEFDIANADLKKAKELLKIYGSKSQGLFDIKSPLSGYIVKKNITESMDIKSDNSLPVFTICDLSDIWVMANVYETDIDKVKLGEKAAITTLSYPDSVIYGKIDKVFNTLDPESKVMKARITLNNPGFLLKPDMYASVSVSVKQDYQLPSIPKTCLVFDNSAYYIIVKTDNKLEVREIERIRTNENYVYVSSGLKAGEMVVSKDALIIYNALNK